jgi:hypothetical protein
LIINLFTYSTFGSTDASSSNDLPIIDCERVISNVETARTLLLNMPSVQSKRKIQRTRTRGAKGFLKHLLVNGDISEFAIHEKAAKVGLPKGALLGAKNALGIIVVEAENGSVWRLPKAENEKRA